MDISQYIHFNPKGGDPSKPPKLKIGQVLNRPCTVRRWSIQPSRFNDGNRLGKFAEIEGEFPGGGEAWRITTASNVIIDQLERIAAAMGDEPSPFTCVFVSFGAFFKMMPATECAEEAEP